MRATVFTVLALTLAACASSTDDTDSSSQNQTASTRFLDGDPVTWQELSTLAPIDGTTASILFPSHGDPVIQGALVGGHKVTVAYALDRLPQCRATHNGFNVWDTKIEGSASNGTKLPATSVVGFDGSSHSGRGHTVPVTFTIPYGADRISFWAHNASPPGPAEACDGWDSKNGANFVFAIEPNPDAPVRDGSGASVSDLAALTPLDGDPNGAAILFPASGDPKLRGNLVAGGHVYVAYAVDRLTKCRALHDGFPYWHTEVKGKFSDGTQVGGEVAEFTTRGVAVTLVRRFEVPADATELELWAHNWNPGGPVDACEGWDSKNSANYHFTVR